MTGMHRNDGASNVPTAPVPSGAQEVTSDIELLVAKQLDVMGGQLALLAGQDVGLARGAASLQPDIMNTPVAVQPSPVFAGSRAGDDRLQDRYLRKFSRRYNESHARSRIYADQHRAYLADSRRAAGFRPAIKSILYPIVGAEAHGAHMRDVDGNDYVDITMGFGVLLTGHTPDFLEAPLARQRSTGLNLGPQSALAGDVARLMVEFTGLPRVTFCNSGTEAVMTAIRLARAATGRNRIVMFAGSYHGHFDGVLALGGTGNRSIPISPGTPRTYVQDVMILEYGSEAALAAIREQANEIAAVLVELVQSRSPDKQPRAFVHALRGICDSSGTALIFDELLTGFRIAPGGAQAWFGVGADIATYGKILGGGTPVGVVAGKARFLDGIDGGNWGYDDGSFPAADRVFFAGTFNKNSSSMVAAKAMLSHLKEQGPQLQLRLNDATSELVVRLNTLFTARSVAISVVWFGSMFRFVIAQDADLFFYHLIQNGIYVWEGRTCFLSTAHGSNEIDLIVGAVERSLDELQSGGFFLPAQDGSAAARGVPPVRLDGSSASRSPNGRNRVARVGDGA